MHTSGLVKAKLKKIKKGWYLYFLPTYSSELKIIEREWHQTKAYKIAGKMFEDEYDLANAVW